MFEKIKQFISALETTSAIKEQAVVDAFLGISSIMEDEDYRAFLFASIAQQMLRLGRLHECLQFAGLITGLDRAEYLSNLSRDVFGAGHLAEAKSLLSDARHATLANELPVEKSRALSAVAVAATDLGLTDQANEIWEEVISVAQPAQALSGVDGPESSSALMVAVKGLIKLGNYSRAKEIAEGIRIQSLREQAILLVKR